MAVWLLGMLLLLFNPGVRSEPVLLMIVYCWPTSAVAGRVGAPLLVQYTYEPDSASVKVCAPVTATTLILCATNPLESPVIHVGEPSPDAITNWSLPVAEGASAPPIITLFEPVVMLSPAW